MDKSSWTFSMTIREKITQPLSAILFLLFTGWSISYRKYILVIARSLPNTYIYAKLQYRFAVIGHPVGQNLVGSVTGLF